MVMAPESDSAPLLIAVAAAAAERFDNLRRMLLLALAPAPHRWRIGLGRLALLVVPGALGWVE